jgi:hypothetical protein
MLISYCRYAGSLAMLRAPREINAMIRRHPSYADDLQFGRMAKSRFTPIGCENVLYSG